MLSLRSLSQFYFLVKITAEIVSINFTGDKWFHILLVLPDHMLFIIENILSKAADVPGVGLYWLIECTTGTFW